MMDGDHYFQLEQKNGNTTFTQGMNILQGGVRVRCERALTGEDLGGSCIGCCYPCLGELIMNDDKNGFVEMNEALKAEVESKHSA
jgi:hypothetical protein